VPLRFFLMRLVFAAGAALVLWQGPAIFFQPLVPPRWR